VITTYNNTLSRLIGWDDQTLFQYILHNCNFDKYALLELNRDWWVFEKDYDYEALYARFIDSIETLPYHKKYCSKIKILKFDNCSIFYGPGLFDISLLCYNCNVVIGLFPMKHYNIKEWELHLTQTKRKGESD
jgi:hypothetical protein